MYFHNLTNTEQEQILNYELMIYVCEGNDREKLDWFKIINIAGEKLTDQELRNAVFTGEWLTDAKKYFSKNGCAAYKISEKYLNGSSIRQDYLETAIRWISENDIEEYMAKHQHEPNANELWLYFQNVINWVKVVFPNYRKEMKGIEWGLYYNKYKNVNYDSKKLEEKVVELMVDDDVTKKSGIYEYLLDGHEKHLNLRIFTDKQKREYFEKHKRKGITEEKINKYVCVCVKCGKEIELNECEADHIIPWSKGGRTDKDNLQFLCKKCNGEKSDK